MKKGVILFFALISIKSVSAQQEVTIFGRNYSLIVVAPIFFMSIMLLFFLGLIIKDNIGKLKLPKVHFNIKRHHEKKEIPHEIRLDHKTKFNILKNRFGKVDSRQLLNEFSQIAKEFFKEKFNIKHEFAFAELGNLVGGHVRDVNLANKISIFKYSGQEIDSLKIKSLFKDFEEILKEYKFKGTKIELGFFRRVKENFLDIFRRKEHKLSIKELKIKAPIFKPTTKEKQSIFSEFFYKFKRDKFKEIPLKLKESEKTIEIVKPVKKYKFVFFDKIKTIFQKNKILSLIEKGKKALLINPLTAKKFYARALLLYYKLPIKEEKEIMNKLMELHNGILNKRIHEKTFLDISKSLVDMKHKGKHISKESINILNTLKNFIEREELLASTKLKEFSYKLKHEEKKLNHFTSKKEKFIGNEFKDDVRKFGTFISELSHKEIKKPEIVKKTINLVDNYNPTFDFLYKQPKVIEHKEIAHEEVKKMPKQLRLLQKQRSELYNRLLELESGKISHNKLN